MQEITVTSFKKWTHLFSVEGKAPKVDAKSNGTFIKKCPFYIETRRKSMTLLENGWILFWFPSALSSFMLVNWTFS